VVLTGEAEAIAQATIIVRASALTPTKTVLLSTGLVDSLGIGRGFGLVTRFQSLSESVKEQSTRLFEVGQKLGLQSTIYSPTDEVDLWQKLPEQMRDTTLDRAVTCKIGVLPSAAIATLNQFELLAPQMGIGLIHPGSGLGLLRFDSPTIKTQTLLKMRTYCQMQGGFLTILEAPLTFKQQLDVWGYRGNALDLMRRIKQQFDSKNILSPHRFVGEI
jgi:glycolate oxidase FAD binding subunit